MLPAPLSTIPALETSSILDKLTNRQANKYLEFGMSDPVVLAQADLTRSFVYDRAFGVIYVPGGFHSNAMSLLLAIHHNCDDGIAVAKKLGLSFSSGTSDHWLETTPGAAFKSSVGTQVLVATGKGFTGQERRLFGCLRPLCHD